MSQQSLDASHRNLYPSPLEYEGRRLEGKVVVVFGASSGIGAAAVTRFAHEGAQVVAAARRADRLEHVVDDVRGEGFEASVSVCDVRVEAEVAQAIADAIDRYGRLDGAFNNAGIPGAVKPIHDVSADGWDETMAVNLRGVALCLKHELRAFRDQGDGGAIVNTSSVGSFGGNPTLPDYGAAKAAVNHLTRSAAVGYGPDGIRVNAIAPGATSSEMLDPWIATPESRVSWASSPIPFIALGDDMARVALFLLSDESRWINGQILTVDGGSRAR
jgi:NAD(P)-dependent dehydrogenase (short-subunit alcohol dehydrogenase family)